jgi:hypothetical protein
MMQKEIKFKKDNVLMIRNYCRFGLSNWEKTVGLFFLLLSLFSLFSCAGPSEKSSAATPNFGTGSFGYDLNFLRQHDSVILLQTDDTLAQVVVSPKYQGKVFTSTASGAFGQSFGWINYKAFSAPLDSHMNAYGGENRLWLGPEGGRFSLFFPKDAEMAFDNWKTPAPIDTEPWTVVNKNGSSVQMQKDMQLTNYAGTEFQLQVKRTVSIMTNSAIQAIIDLPFDTALKAVGYETNNTLTNTGKNEWTSATGAPCIWILDMFNPSPETTIVIPYEESGSGPVATTNYFGAIPPDRIRWANGVLFFKADGRQRGKLGIAPQRAKRVAGSYDAAANVLTLTFFDLDKSGQYLNQEWSTAKPPYSGDAVNAYNDGPLADGKQMGPFYEIESVSPAAFLKPASSLTHHHTVLHFTGKKEMLNQLAEKQLGVTLTAIQGALAK